MIAFSVQKETETVGLHILG